MDIQQRLQVFFSRLAQTPAAGNADEAMELICKLIENVEDELCPTPRREPPPLAFTGRMYAPQPDRMRRLTNGTLVADTRHHRIYCQPDGSLSIMHIPSRKTIVTKKGRKN